MEKTVSKSSTPNKKEQELISQGKMIKRMKKRDWESFLAIQKKARKVLRHTLTAMSQGNVNHTPTKYVPTSGTIFWG